MAVAPSLQLSGGGFWCRRYRLRYFHSVAAPDAWRHHQVAGNSLRFLRTMTPPKTLRLTNRHTGEVLELWREKRDGEVVLVLRGSLPPHRQGPPMHIHHLEDEEGLVTAGNLSAEVGGKQLTFGPGEIARLPRGVPHRWWNDGDVPLAFEGCTRPVVDLDRYLQAAFEILSAGSADRPPLFYLAHLALRHRRTQTVLVMPTAVQAILFRVLVAVGTLLGKYRGTEWPGCPARCTGVREADS